MRSSTSPNLYSFRSFTNPTAGTCLSRNVASSFCVISRISCPFMVFAPAAGRSSTVIATARCEEEVCAKASADESTRKTQNSLRTPSPAVNGELTKMVSMVCYFLGPSLQPPGRTLWRRGTRRHWTHSLLLSESEQHSGRSAQRFDAQDHHRCCREKS